MDGLDRFEAALGAVTMPKTERWLGLTVYDKDLARSPNVQRWLEHASDRCGIASTRRTRQFRRRGERGPARARLLRHRRAVGRRSQGPRAVLPRAAHERDYIDVDFRGRVDTVHRKFELTARQAAQMFGEDNLSDKMRQAYADPASATATSSDPARRRPNDDYQPDALDYRGKPIASRYIASTRSSSCAGRLPHHADPGVAQFDRAGPEIRQLADVQGHGHRSACRRWPRPSCAPAQGGRSGARLLRRRRRPSW
jgi:hypothetical protein